MASLVSAYVKMADVYCHAVRSAAAAAPTLFCIMTCSRVTTLQMYNHIGDLPRKLPEHNTAVYDYAACPPITYPELQDEMWCHRYYLRNLCDVERFPDWPIVDHVPFLQVRLCCEQWHACQSL